MLGTLILLAFVLIACGAIAYLVRAAPFIAEPFKSAVLWLVLLVAVVYTLVVLYGLVKAAV